jgi:predicted DNA-binding protein (UPF0251 family)
MTANIKFYKKVICGLDYSKMNAIIGNSRLSKEERRAVELADLEETPNKISADIMHTNERQFNAWLHRARLKITRQILK